MIAWAKRRIGIQLLLVLILVSLGPLFGAGYLMLRETETSLRSQVEAHHAQSAQIAANLISDYLRESATKLRTAALVFEEREYEDPDKELEKRMAAAGVFLDLSYYHTGPKNYYANSQQSQYREAQEMRGGNKLDPKVNPAIFQEPFFVEAKAGNTFISPKVEEIQGIPYVVIAVPVGKLGVLAAHVNFGPINEILQRIAGTTRRITVTGGGRTLEWGGTPEEPLLVTTRPVGHHDWQVTVRESTKESLAAVRRARSQSLLWIGGAALLSLALSTLIGLRIVRPIRSLTRTAEQVGRGDLAVRTGIDREDEIGVLARQFDRMAESLEQLDRLKSDFVSHVSHELRTPLTSAKLSLANLEDEVIGPVTPKQKEVLSRIRKDTDRLIHMVNELLDLARLEAGKVTLEKERVEIAPIVEQAAATVRPLAAQKGVALSVEGKGFALDGDRGKLVQIALNLIDNAVKFTPSGGRVSVRLGEREIVVEDSGPGLGDPEAIFEKFAMRKQPGVPGVGLGLSITRKLVELHGGTIRATNRPEGGARFRVSF